MASKGQGQVDVRITATDQVTSVLKDINARLTAFQKPFKDLQNQLNRFQKLTGLSKIGQDFKALGGHMKSTLGTVIKLVPVLGTLTGLASLGGLGKLVTQTSDWANNLSKAAKNLGVTTSEFQQLQNAGSISGAGQDAVTHATQFVQDRRRNIKLGLDREGLQLYQSWGIKDNGNDNDVIAQLLDKVNTFKDPASRRRAAELAGVSDLANTYKNGGEYRQSLADATKYGASDKDVSQSNDLGKSLRTMEAAAQGLATTFAGELSPAFKPIVDDMTNWTNGIKNWMQSSPDFKKDMSWLADKARDLGHWLEAIDWGKVKKDATDLFDQVEGWGKTINDFVNKDLGGWKTVLEGIVAIKVTSTVTSWLAPLAQLAAAFGLFSGTGAAALGIAALTGFAATEGYDAVKDVHDLTTDEGRHKDRKLRFDSGDKYYKWGGVDGHNSPLAIAGRNQELYNYGVNELGLDHKVVAGMLGNMQVESGLNSNAIGDNGDAIGLVQAHSGVEKLLDKYGNGKRYADGDMFAQFKDAAEVLKNEPEFRGVYEGMKDANSAGEASNIFMNGFERPQERVVNGRVRGAIADKIDHANSYGPSNSQGGQSHVTVRIEAAPGTRVTSTEVKQGAGPTIKKPQVVSTGGRL